jgi:hypothetical protein
MDFLSLLAFVSLFSTAFAATIPQPRAYGEAPEHHVVHQFPDPTWVENIAVRSNGQLLVDIITSPDIYLIDPPISSLDPASAKTTTLVHSFAPELSVIGITEVERDHFYCIVGNVSLATKNLGLGTYGIYSVNLQTYNSISNTGAIISPIAELPQAGLLNGMTTLDVSKGLVIMADSTEGAIWILNVKTGTYSILLQTPEMAPPAAGGPLALGINGVRLHRSGDTATIYFSNQGAGIFYRFPLSISTLKPTGPIVPVKTDVVVDDFALDVERGVAYLASSNQNAVLQQPLDGGDYSILLGGTNSTELPGPTSVALGRGGGEKGVIYVTTNGGLLAPINGTYSEGGKVVAIELDC